MNEIKNLLREVAYSLELLVYKNGIEDTELFDSLYRIMTDLKNIYDNQKSVDKRLGVIIEALGRKTKEIQGEEEFDPNNILISLCNLFNITKAEVFSEDRVKPAVWKRQVISFLLNDYYNIPNKIVCKMVNRDHSTLSYAKKQIFHVIKEDLKTDPLFLLLETFDKSTLNPGLRYTKRDERKINIQVRL